MYNYDLVEFLPSSNNSHKNEIKRLYQCLTESNILNIIDILIPIIQPYMYQSVFHPVLRKIFLLFSEQSKF